jgi:hypothetical protein
LVVERTHTANAGETSDYADWTQKITLNIKPVLGINQPLFVPPIRGDVRVVIYVTSITERNLRER